LHKRLKSFGTPVQYSVFECILTEQLFQQLRVAVLDIIEPEVDQVRYYSLCQSCRARIESINGAITQEIGTIVV
jgi:CRISPR-associated protein Cas2